MSKPSYSANQPGGPSETLTTADTSSGSAADIFKDLPYKPASALKKEGWNAFMREVTNSGGLVVTHRNKPEAVVLSMKEFEAMKELVLREQKREAQQLAELSARVDQRLAVLEPPQGRQALDAFMEEPVELNGKVRAGATY